MTRKILSVIAVLALAFIPITLAAYHGNGGGGYHGGGNGNRGGNGYGPGNGTGPIHDILAGTPITYSGTVVSAGYWGNGMVISTADGNIKLYGLGSWRYWNSLNVKLPDVGEQIVVKGYTVEFNGSPRNILMSAEIDGVVVQLRDPETGIPLWRRNGGGYRGGGNGGYGGYGNCPNRGEPRYDILNGIPFSFTGELARFGSGYGNKGINGGRHGRVTIISTSNGNMVVSGLGPWWFWNKQGIDYPIIGDTLAANGFTVDVNGFQVNILMSVTIGGTTVQLRDIETGTPLWWRRSGSK